ncbi:MAG TPA: PIN domain-containing protein [Chloroflexota bacterium]|nr:PIN domain-containing protein [Chloroflexota bacterium]
MSRTPGTPRVFIDSTVLFAAAYSATGTARDLLRAGLRGRVQLYISDDVLEETERNLRRKAPEALDQFLLFKAVLNAQLVRPPPALVARVAEVVAAKDAPIVAAALAARASYLATWDRKHLLRWRAQIKTAFNIAVVTPAEVPIALE